MNPNDEGLRAIDQDEHNGDAHAKRVIPRYQNPNTGNWSNFVPDLVAGVDFDYIDAQQPNATTDVYVFKLGGSSGTTIQTITITYVDSTKADIDTIAWT